MKKMFRQSIAAMFVFLALGSCLNAQSKSYTPVTTFDPKRNAAVDIADAIDEAARTYRYVMIDVGGNWCIWCRYFDKFFEDHPNLQEFRDANFIVVKVNFSPENENKKVLSQYPKISGYPHLFFLDDKGKLIKSQDTSVLEQGRGDNPEAIERLLKEMAPKLVSERAERGH